MDHEPLSTANPNMRIKDTRGEECSLLKLTDNPNLAIQKHPNPTKP